MKTNKFCQLCQFKNENLKDCSYLKMSIKEDRERTCLTCQFFNEEEKACEVEQKFVSCQVCYGCPLWKNNLNFNFELLVSIARKHNNIIDFVEKGLSELEGLLYHPFLSDLCKLQSKEFHNAKIWKNILKQSNLTKKQINQYQIELEKSEYVVRIIKKLRLAGFNTYEEFYNQAVNNKKEE